MRSLDWRSASDPRGSSSTGMRSSSTCTPARRPVRSSATRRRTIPGTGPDASVPEHSSPTPASGRRFLRASMRVTSIRRLGEQASASGSCEASCLLAAEETVERKFATLRMIQDSRPELVLSMDPVTRSWNGMRRENIMEFRLSDENCRNTRAQAKRAPPDPSARRPPRTFRPSSGLRPPVPPRRRRPQRAEAPQSPQPPHRFSPPSPRTPCTRACCRGCRALRS